jgi:hypothetical protein
METEKTEREKIVNYLRRRFRETWEARKMVNASALETFLLDIERGEHMKESQ